MAPSWCFSWNLKRLVDAELTAERPNPQFVT
uniref:Uncharacterized protein n=1 Tax=Arundo donax TaxID=35708 RepID=A0A0A9GRH8_ARUDO